MPADEAVSLATLAGGAAVERFDYELQRVLENIADFNTKPDAVREVILKVKIKPDHDRAFTIAEIQASSKLAPVKPETTSIYVHSSSSGVTATEYNPRQERMPFEEKTK